MESVDAGVYIDVMGDCIRGVGIPRPWTLRGGTRRYDVVCDAGV